MRPTAATSTIGRRSLSALPYSLSLPLPFPLSLSLAPLSFFLVEHLRPAALRRGGGGGRGGGARGGGRGCRRWREVAPTKMTTIGVPDGEPALGEQAAVAGGGGAACARGAARGGGATSARGAARGGRHTACVRGAGCAGRQRRCVLRAGSNPQRPAEATFGAREESGGGGALRRKSAASAAIPPCDMAVKVSVAGQNQVHVNIKQPQTVSRCQE